MKRIKRLNSTLKLFVAVLSISSCSIKARCNRHGDNKPQRPAPRRVSAPPIQRALQGNPPPGHIVPDRRTRLVVDGFADAVLEMFEARRNNAPYLVPQLNEQRRLNHRAALQRAEAAQSSRVARRLTSTDAASNNSSLAQQRIQRSDDDSSADEPMLNGEGQ